MKSSSQSQVGVVNYSLMSFHVDIFKCFWLLLFKPGLQLNRLNSLLLQLHSKIHYFPTLIVMQSTYCHSALKDIPLVLLSRAAPALLPLAKQGTPQHLAHAAVQVSTQPLLQEDIPSAVLPCILELLAIQQCPELAPPDHISAFFVSERTAMPELLRMLE